MEDEVRQIQLKCLELLKIVDSICRRHKIQYSLCGGSVVGAYLYGGCLPWDDDIDLMMTRDNYNKFNAVVLEELPEGISVHNYQLSDEYSSLFTKIVDDKTTVVQQDGTVSGIFLDITVYDRVPKNYRQKEDIFLWKISQVVAIGKIKEKSLKASIRNVILTLFFKNPSKYFRYFQKRVEKNGKTSEYHYSELFGAFCNTKPYAREIFENYAEIEFEGNKYMIVRDYVKYLETRYERTDFREPKDKQVAPHYLFVDLSVPYRQYMKEKMSYEKK